MPGGAVGGFQIADHPAAAVIPNQDWERPIAFRRVDADGDVAGGAGNVAILHLAYIRPDGPGTHGRVGASFLRRNRVVGRQTQGAGRLNYLLRLRMQWHGGPPF